MSTSRRPSAQTKRTASAPPTESVAPVTVSTNPPPPAPEEPKLPLERVGDLLKRVRLERGDDLQQIADYLCIRKSFLVALENNRYDEFPADAYVIGFLRSYAEYLGVNGKDAIDRYRNEMAGRRKKPALTIPTPITEGRTPSAIIMAGAAVAALLVYALWYGISSSDRSSVSTPPALPTAAAPATPETASPAPPGITEMAEQPAAPASLPAETKTESATSAAASMPVGTAAGIALQEPAPPTSLQAPAPEAVHAEQKTPAAAPDHTQSAAADAKPAHLLIRAEQSSWVLVTDGKGRPIYDHVMKPGDTYKVPDWANLSLTTGNGAGITLVLNGADLPKLSTGTAHVVRNIPLTDQYLKALPANTDE